ncbi:MAG: hypothetical protein ACTSYF_05115 [Promethearchaeota archaeon]
MIKDPKNKRYGDFRKSMRGYYYSSHFGINFPYRSGIRGGMTYYNDKFFEIGFRINSAVSNDKRPSK